MLCYTHTAGVDQILSARNPQSATPATDAGGAQFLSGGAAGVVVAALSGGSFRMVGPIYGTAVGLKIDQIAYFLAAFVLGGALAQIPVG